MYITSHKDGVSYILVDSTELTNITFIIYLKVWFFLSTTPLDSDKPHELSTIIETPIPMD